MPAEKVNKFKKISFSTGISIRIKIMKIKKLVLFICDKNYLFLIQSSNKQLLQNLLHIYSLQI